MKKILLSIMVLIHTYGLFGQPCSQSNITLLSQGDVDNFHTTFGPCDTITGTLTIGDFSATTTDITSLIPLLGIRTLNSLIIVDNDSLESLAGLQNIVKDNISKLTVTRNLKLNDISQLSGIGPTAGDVGIAENPALPNIIGLQGLRTIGTTLQIRDLPLITNLNPLSGVNRIDKSLIIQNNDALTDISGLSNLVLYGTGLNPVFILKDNDILEDCSALCYPIQRILPLLNNLTKEIQDNLGNCVDEAAILNACLEENNGIYSGSDEVPSGTIVSLEQSVQFDDSTFVIDGVHNRVGLGVVTPQATLHVDGTLTLSSLPASGTLDKVLAIDTDGNTFQLDISNYDSDASDDFSGSFNDLTDVPGDLADGDDDTQLSDGDISAFGYIKNADDADADPTNELYDDLEIRDSIAALRNDMNDLNMSGLYHSDGSLSSERNIDLNDFQISFDDSLFVVDGTTNRIGIGVKNPSHELDINGDIGISGGIFGLSDARLKMNKKPILNALEVISKLNPVTYEFRNSDFPVFNLPERRQYGLIAQDLAEILPELVSSKNGPDGGEYLTVNYNGLIAILIQAVIELQNK